VHRSQTKWCLLASAFGGSRPTRALELADRAINVETLLKRPIPRCCFCPSCSAFPHCASLKKRSTSCGTDEVAKSVWTARSGQERTRCIHKEMAQERVCEHVLNTRFQLLQHGCSGQVWAGRHDAGLARFEESSVVATDGLPFLTDLFTSVRTSAAIKFDASCTLAISDGSSNSTSSMRSHL
jgi:hypothetical protein